MKKALMEFEFSALKLVKKGKIREVYDLGDRLLIVATDRLSAFDVILPDGIPGKGEVLTELSAFWFRKLETVAPNHLISTDPKDLPEAIRSDESIHRRFMIVRRTEPIAFECIVRGFLLGHGWAEYSSSGQVSGVKLPPGLREGEALADPIFTPTTKAPQGEHDEPISFDAMRRDLGEKDAEWVRDRSLALYRTARAFARERGIVIADTKFEFGKADGRMLLIDECLTPDSSRFWPADGPTGPGATSLDKQYVRDHLIRSGWDRKPPAPRLPADVIQETVKRYGEILQWIATT